MTKRSKLVGGGMLEHSRKKEEHEQRFQMERRPGAQRSSPLPE